MTKEQEQAIEKLNSYKSHIENCGNIKSKHYKAVKTVLNLIQTQKEEIEKKDKIIDEMAKMFYEFYKLNPGTVDKLFNHKICITDDCDNINREVNCDTCIKQYFERKAMTSNDNKLYKTKVYRRKIQF